MKTLAIIISISFIFSTYAFCQDLHFSNYEYSPLYLSPAKTGHYAGSLRVGANVREQYSSFFERPYQTLMAYVDSPISRGFFKNQWIGAGLNVYTDKAGDSAFSNTGFFGSLAYHIGLDEDYKNVVSLGVQYGANQKRIDGSLLNFEEELNGSASSSPDRNLLMNFNPNVNDLNVGLTFKKATSENSHIEVGAAVYHLLQPKYAFSDSDVINPIGQRLNVYGEYHLMASERTLIKPVVVYSKMYNFQNLYGQFNLEHQVNKKSSTIIKGGLGYRAGDALQLLAGVIYKGWNVGLAYDLTVSSAKEYNNSFGAIELGVYKIFSFKKKQKDKKIKVNKQQRLGAKMLCPRL